MAITETRQLPPQFIQDLGEDLGTQLIAQSGRPTVAPGIDPATGKRLALTQFAGESDTEFAKRQQAAQEFDVRKQNIAGLAPTVADQTQLQKDAQALATQAAGTSGLASFQPFLDRAQTQADEAARLAGVAEKGITTAGERLDTAGTTLGGVPLGAKAFQQDVLEYMSPYQSQVIDATLKLFDRDVERQQLELRDQQAKLGVLGTGRAGVQLGELGTGAALQKALLKAQLEQQGFNQAQAARQQDIQNRFGLGAAQQGIAGAQQNLGAFRSGLGGQQAQLGGILQGLEGTNIGRLGQLGALNQAQAQAEADAAREAARQATFLPQQNLDRFAAQVTGLMGGYPGQTQQTVTPNLTPLQTALGVGTTLAGIYGAIKNPTSLRFG